MTARDAPAPVGLPLQKISRDDQRILAAHQQDSLRRRSIFD
jgi:hypothetical protein